MSLGRRRHGLLSVAALLLSFLATGVMAEEEEEAPSPVAISISVMLLGNIGFQMMLFYLVNWPDPDIRRYSWKVISDTISIFCAVLLFQACNGVVEDYVMKGGTEMWEVMVDIMQLVFWLTSLQIVLALASGAVQELIGGAEPELEKVKLNLKSWSVLFAHLSGFSSINAWGSVQQKLLNGSPAMALLAVPLGFFGLWGTFHGWDKIRQYISTMDDGEEDEFEVLWDEFTEEAENDVAGLSLSFLTVQALRFHLGGFLPNQEGGETKEQEVSHMGEQWHHLLLSSIVFFILSMIPLLLEQRMEPEEGTLALRAIEFLNNYFNFGTAWCCFYGTKWYIASLQLFTQEALLLVVIALFLSAASFSFIFVLDKIEDNHVFGKDSEMTEEVVEKLIAALAMLIGFSWEQCFDTAVSVVAASTRESCPPAICKLILSMVLVAIVFPAWRVYILPTESELSEETDESMIIKKLVTEHKDMFSNPECDEHRLDLAHLQMKSHRRKVLDLPIPGHDPHADLSHLKHMRVTGKGVVMMEPPPKKEHHHGHGHKKKRTIKQDLEESLLG